jgi:hypothetical protein
MQTDYWRFMRHMHTGSPAVCRFAYAPDGAAVAAATTPGTQTARGVIKLAHLQRGSETVQPVTPSPPAASAIRATPRSRTCRCTRCPRTPRHLGRRHPCRFGWTTRFPSATRS